MNEVKTMEIIAKCGNRCDICPAYRENIAQYGAEAVSENWNRYLKFYLPADKIECAGCHAEGYRPAGDCAIRKCCVERAYDNCAACPEMICVKLKHNIDAMDELEKAQESIPEEIYAQYFAPYQNRNCLLKVKNENKTGGINMGCTELTELKAQYVLYIRTRTTMEKLPEVIGKSYMKIMEYLEGQGVQPADVPYTAYHNLDMQDLDVEMGFPVAGALPEIGEVHAREIPAGAFASYMHKGPYSAMEKPYNELFKWMSENGYEQDGPCYGIKEFF